MRPWNGSEFVKWAQTCCHRIEVLSRDDSHHAIRAQQSRNFENNAPESLLILIQDIHQLNYYRGGGSNGTDPVSALMQLLTTARQCLRRDSVRVLLTCGESPGQFPQDIQVCVQKLSFTRSLTH
jgi:hypothetical protein